MKRLLIVVALAIACRSSQQPVSRPHTEIDSSFANAPPGTASVVTKEDLGKWKPAAQARPEPAEPREPGVSARFYFVGEPMERICLLAEKQVPNVWEVLPVLDLESDKEDTALGMQYTFMAVAEGFLNVAEAGSYALRLRSDDGSKLWLDGNMLIDHDGLHSPSSRDQSIQLSAGEHPLRVQFFQTYGGWVLKLLWKRPGASEFEIVPASALTCRKEDARETAPGAKRIIKPLERGSPGDGLEVEGLHPSFDLMTVRPEGFEPKVGGIAWLPDGRMVITTWDPIGGVYFLDGVQGDDRAKITVKRFAAGLAEPLGVCVVGERIFVLQKQELTELVDHDQDGVADEYRCVCAAWKVSPNFHEFTFGLLHKDGWLYLNLSTAILPGGKSASPQVVDRGSTIRVKLEDGSWEVVARGLRTPNGIGLGVDGQIFVSDNQGDWLPASKIVHVKPGAFFGSRSVLGDAAKDLPVTQPVVWLPQDEIGNSPGNPVLIPPGVGPYSGQMCHPDVTHGGVKRDFVEKVEGEYQGCVFRWTQGLEAGINRVSWGPDGALYVGGVGSVGNWGQDGKKRFGLQRLKFNGKPTFEMLALRARSNGFEVELTEPIAEGLGSEPESWRVEQWRYVPTTDYGGPKVDPEVLKVRSASVSADRRKVFLEIEGLKPEHVVYLRVVGQIVGESGAHLWSTEAWYTLNRIPKSLSGAVAANAPKRAQNVLSEAERKQGWRLLFDGKTTKGWRGYKQKDVPAGWKVVDGALVRVAEGGDLVTEEEFQDFELSLEWRISTGGNSGVMFHVTEDHDYPWETGPEYQILDNEKFRYDIDPRTSAGANYALHAPARDLTRPTGLWNQARILVKGPHVEHWLNGTKLLEYELWSPEWKELVAASKFGAMPDYGRRPKGKIDLQEHGAEVAFRNLKIRPLGSP